MVNRAITIKCGQCGKIDEAKELIAMVRYQCRHCLAINEVTNVPLKEWIGFDYQRFLFAIKAFIKNDKFTLLLAENELEKQAGYLTVDEIDQLKQILSTAFTQGQSIRDIANKIQNEMDIQPVLKMSDGKIVTDEAGDPIVTLSAEARPLVIARTESTRVAAGGALDHYTEGGVEQVRFLASSGSRTCPDCASMNGDIYSIVDSYGVIPVHTLCRCAWIPVTPLG